MAKQQDLKWERRYPDIYDFTIRHPNDDGSVNIPNFLDGHMVKSIWLNILKSTEEVKTLFIPASVEEIKCHGKFVTESVVVAPENNYLSTDGKAIYDKNGEILISMLIDNTDAYSIPETVKKIEGGAFSDCTNLTSITIADSVVTIGSNAFRGCKSLTSVTLPASLEELGEGAFYECEKLNDVVGGENLGAVHPSAFWGTAWIKKSDYVVLGSTLIEINSNDEDLILPETVRHLPEKKGVIGSCLFTGSKKINKLSLNEGLETISGKSFDFFRNIKSVYIPASIKNINDDVFVGGFAWRHGANNSFSNLSILESIEVAEANEYYKSINGVLFSKDGKKLIAYPTAKKSEKYVIPDGTESVASSAFLGNSYLHEIILPDSVSQIGNKAFEGMNNLQKIKLSDYIQEIPDSTFAFCENLTEINFPKELRRIGHSCFSYSGIQSVDIPDDVETIGSWAFDKAFENATVVIPRGMKEIGYGAFGRAKELVVWDDSELKGLEVQSALITVLDHNTRDIKYRVYMDVFDEPGKVLDMMHASWNGANFKFENLDTIFGDLKNMNNKVNIALLRLDYPYELPAEAEKKYKAFLKRNGYKVVKSFIDSAKNEEIQKLVSYEAITDKTRDELLEYANKAHNLEAAAIILESIGSNKSNKKKTITLDDNKGKLWDTKPDNPELVGKYNGNDLIVHFPESFDGIKICGTRNLTGKNPETYKGIKEVVIPEGYKELGNNTFKDCVNLEKVSLPSSIERIGDRCFANCSSLKAIVLPEKVKELGKEAFSGCESLASIILSKEMERLGDSAFKGCSSLKEIDLGENIRYLGSNCFTTAWLKKVVFRGEFCYCPEHMCFSYPRYVYTDGTINALGIPASTHMPLAYLGIEVDEIAHAANKKLLKDMTIYGCGKLKAFPKNVDLRFRGISFEDFVKEFGGTYSKTYSKKVDLVVVYKIDKNNVTQQKAVANGTAIIPEKEFLDQLRKNEAIDFSSYKPSDAETKAVAEKKKTSKDDPFRPAIMKKIWGFNNLEDGTIELTDYKGNDEEIIIPERIGDNPVTRLGRSLFSPLKERRKNDRAAFMKTIKKVTIPESVTSFGSSVFSCCESLMTVNIPYGVEELPCYMFSRCSSLESLTLSETVCKIDEYAFSDCSSLKSINISETMRLGSGAFKGCDHFADKDGFITIHDILFGYSGNDKEVIVPDGVKEISRDAFFEPYAFLDNSPVSHTLEAITLPDSVKTIGRDAFGNCINLKKISGVEAVNNIEPSAFSGCTGLRDENGFIIINEILYWYSGDEREITIPPIVTEIATGALFDYSLDLKTIHVPDSVKVIHKMAINGGITIVGNKGGEAERYARDNNLKFKTEQ